MKKKPKGWRLIIVDGFEYYWTHSRTYILLIRNPLVSSGSCLDIQKFFEDHPCPNSVTPVYVEKAIRWYYSPENKKKRNNQ